jgi:hypothetical protein
MADITWQMVGKSLGRGAMDGRGVGGPRAVAVSEFIEELLERPGRLGAGDFNALAMMVSEAASDADEESLAVAHEGLQRLYGLQAWLEEPSTEQVEARGRVLGLVELLQWALRRVAPKALLSRLEPNGYARRFLEAAAEQPGISNTELAERLATDATEVSRVGRRLVENGLATKRKLGRRNHWEITPRGAQAVRPTEPAV